MNIIIAETPDYLLVDKPAGVLSQGDKSGDEEICAFLRKIYPGRFPRSEFLAPAHRLDRNTSGLLLLARSPESAARFTEQLKNKKISRRYLALVKGDPGENGSFAFPLEKNSQTNEVRVSEKGKPAITRFRRLYKLGSSSWVSIELDSGRSHQIRVHFAHAGHALLGDKKYAKKPWSEIFHRPALHAAELKIPDGNKFLSYKAPLPEDLQGLLKKMGAKNIDLG